MDPARSVRSVPRSRRRRLRTVRGALACAGTSALVLSGVVAGVETGAAGPARADVPSAGQAADQAADCASAVVSAMTLEQRVGQLFVAGVDASGPTTDQLAMVTSEHLGGVILTGRSSAGTAATRRITDALRARSGGTVTGGVGLWVSTDQEGGYVQVLSGPGFSQIPTALSQGGLPPATLRAHAAGWGGELRAAGVDLNLAPVLDTVPASLGTGNRPIGYYAREYAHDPAGVSASGTAFAAGLRDAGVQATAKHFPGLGRVIDNTDTTTGVTDDVTVRGDAYLQPFADAVNNGIPVVMVSSAIYSKIDPSSIATFSPVVIGQMLRGDLGFGGVIMSDSLGAAALANVPVADRAVRFIDAGGTVALSAQSRVVAPMVDGVLSRARSDAAFQDKVDAAARKVVEAKFADGLVTCPDAAGAIAEHYAQLGGSASLLGAPVGALNSVAGGAVQDYQYGAIYWSSSTGAHEVHGEIQQHYNALGGPEGILGFPVTDETGTPDGIGRYNHFDGSGGASIYWTPSTGAWSVHGNIRAHWAALGWEQGPLGYPTSDETGTADGRGRYNTFSTGGAIYWTPSTGAWSVHGSIYERWIALGGATGILGFPVTDETGTPDGIGRYNHFDGSGGASIYWTPSTGAWSVHGAIRAHWAALGWERGPMGYPVTDENTTPDGIGRYNHFTGGDGASIYWTPATGAWSVHGAIRNRWAQQGWERGPLGYPVSDEYGISGGRRRSDFQGGSLIWPFTS